MELQIIQFNRLTQNEAYKKAEQYHNGNKFGEYYRLLKLAHRSLRKFDLALAALTNKLKRQRFSKSSEFTTGTN
jgi:hypothetical protein